MLRCLDLAMLGAGSASPNPMVGCVIVCGDKIIAEGFHRQYGGPHAEVNAINSLEDDKILKDSTLYVNLEPCSHQGLTPPCADLIIAKKIPRVIIGSIDPNIIVAGKGIKKMIDAGIEVTTGILEKECSTLNKRFFTYHQKKRPYIILKWAQTTDGFIDINRTPENYGMPTWITGELARRLVHKIRSVEDAILVGTNTAQKDDPSLTVRHWHGRNPLRVVVDKNLRLSKNLKLFKPEGKTLIFNSEKESEEGSISYVKIDFEREIITQVLNILYRQKILSLVVEGGRKLLESFIDKKMWDETHIFIGDKFFFDGVKAPQFKGKLLAEETLDADRLKIFINPD